MCKWCKINFFHQGLMNLKVHMGSTQFTAASWQHIILCFLILFARHSSERMHSTVNRILCAPVMSRIPWGVFPLQEVGVILESRDHWCMSLLQEFPPNGQWQELLQGLTNSLLRGRYLDQSQKSVGGAWGLLGSDWLNLEHVTGSRSGALA